ncbi:glycosyltransferase [Hanstruepera marina]|uniref:glycosyltransferase n=1 Tax=Hanstruepera marina TaxID=2873265 RepID=UPI001CA79A63|nr:glycosyltransferase [Hanstruepera marina]
MPNKWTYRWSKLKLVVKHYLNLVYNSLCNRVVARQKKDPKSIPIIIISYNQLTHIKQLVNWLLENYYKNIIIVDNKSTYPPLMEYLRSIEGPVKVEYLKKNEGHLAFWKNKNIFKKYSKGYYVVTDADILPIDECPGDMMWVLMTLLDKAYDRTKVGLSLKIDDIPEHNPNKKAVENWEKQFWKSECHSKAYKAEIDTTWAMYRPGYKYKLKHFTKAWRSKPPYMARHEGWYVDTGNLTEEQKYYMQTANESASWNIDSNGNLVNTVHKDLYND